MRVAALGKSGSVSALLKTLGTMTPDERKAQGPLINGLKDRGQRGAADAPRRAEERRARPASQHRKRRRHAAGARDPAEAGRIHPISQVIDELTAIFADMGFAVAEGPDIETDDYNFTKLNFPEGHPAREMHDTFYFTPKPDGSRLLAAHAHLAGADPHHAGAEAADPRDHSRPHLSFGLRPDPHADVPSGRGPGHRQGLRISAT